MATRSDPSGCALLWRSLAAECARRFAALATSSWHHAMAGGLEPDSFLAWFDARLAEVLRGDWAEVHVSKAYRKGARRAFVDAMPPTTASVDHRAGQAEQFLRSFLLNTASLPGGMVKNAMGRLERTMLSARTRSVILARKAHGNFKGLGDEARKKVARLVTEGFLAGDHPFTVAKRMSKAVRGLAKARARTIARTEIIGAHAQGQLDSFRAQGFETVGLMAEWSTAKDAKVCERCRKMEGRQYSLDVAQGMLPLHPNCRCAWVPGTPKSVRPKAPKPRRIKDTRQALEPGDEKTQYAELVKALGERARKGKKRRKLEMNARRAKLSRLRRVGRGADPVQLYSPAHALGTPSRPNTGGFSTWRV